jgi:hypothetical protein
MRSLWFRCLVALSFALASWNGHGLAHGGTALAEHCQAAHEHTGTGGAHHHSQGAADVGCCCDYLACASAAIVTAGMSVAAPDFSAVAYGSVNAASLSNRTPLLEPHPPKPIALS